MKGIYFEERGLELLESLGLTKSEFARRMGIQRQNVNVYWKLCNPSQRRFNLSLNEYINIRFVSITETCAHASRNYLSTLAVLQLDAILTNAKRVSTVRSKDNGNQRTFEKIIIMKYDCVGIGVVKMTVGVRRRTHEKVQYCITALKIEKDASRASL